MKSTSPGGGRSLRGTEEPLFHRWFRAVTVRRTALVGWILIGFSALFALMYGFGGEYRQAIVYLSFGVATGVGQALIRRRREVPHSRMALGGELLIVGSAIAWMFLAVAERIDVGYGLAEFVLGMSALALLRFMYPTSAFIVFPTLAAMYGIVLAAYGSFEFEAWLNGLVFSVFALVAALSSFRNQKTTFQNEQLLAELNRQNAHLTTLALKDPLTGLFNRRSFDQMLERMWSSSDQRPVPIVLVLLDIDHFKVYNDQFGHPAGDACLQRVARVLERDRRPGETALRLGGEEFAVLRRPGTLTDGRRIADFVREQIAGQGEITVSVGVSSLSPLDGKHEELYRTADEALYRAKEAGRNRVVTA